jgi:hypothetical protein
MKNLQFEHLNNATTEEQTKFERGFTQYLSFSGKTTDNLVIVSTNRKGTLRAVYFLNG